jgi:hypothetical protein
MASKSALDQAARDKLYLTLSTKERIDTAILPTILFMGMSAITNKVGHVFREDVMNFLDIAAQKACLGVSSEGMKIKIMKEASDVSMTILDAFNPDSEVQALKCAALMIVCMAEQGLLVDVESNAVMAAILLTHEAQAGEHGEMWGPWIDDELKIQIDRGLRAAQLAGHL